MPPLARAIKRRGIRSEYLVRDIFRKHGWVVIRSGGSLGPADLVCIKEGVVYLAQVKSSNRPTIYIEEMSETLMGLPLLVIVNFGRGNIRVVPHKRKISKQEGIPLKEFLSKR